MAGINWPFCLSLSLASIVLIKKGLFTRLIGKQRNHWYKGPLLTLFFETLEKQQFKKTV